MAKENKCHKMIIPFPLCITNLVNTFNSVSMFEYIIQRGDDKWYMATYHKYKFLKKETFQISSYRRISPIVTVK
jgi:hypothetical protein